MTDTKFYGSTEEVATENNEMTAAEGFTALAGCNPMEAAEDLTGLTITPDRLKMPSGGGTAFELPGDDDEPEMVKSITGVILYQHPVYAYYKDKYNGGSNPPDCGSYDGITGVGDPGGSCAECPYNQYGSGDGRAKACKNRRMLYILMEGELFPVTLSLPTGSLKEFTKYVKRQLSKGRTLSQIVTKISLKKVTNASGIAYSQAVFTFDRALDSAELAAIEPMVDQVKAYAAGLNSAVSAEDEDMPVVDAETGEIIEPLR